MPGVPSNADRECPFATICIAASTIAAVIAIIGILMRFGFSESGALPILKALGLSWFLINFPDTLLRIIRCEEPTSHRTLLFHRGTLALLALLLSIGASALCGFIGPSVGWALVVFGYLLFVWRLTFWLVAASFRATATTIAATLLLSLYMSATIWGIGYLDPLFLESIANGYAHVDELFHASVCNLIKTSGVVSSGLDGTPWLLGHFGSHWLFSRFSLLLHMPAMHFYHLAFPVICLPLFIYSTLVFTLSVSEAMAGNAASVVIRGNRLFWLLLLAGFIGFLPTRILKDYFIDDLGFTSESNCLGIAISLLALSLVPALFERLRNPTGLSASAILVVVVLLPTLLGVIGWFKMSVMYLLLAVTLFAFVRLALYRSWIFVFATIAAIASCAVAAHLVHSPYYSQLPFMPFGSIRAYVKGWIPCYVALYYAWTWAYLILMLRRRGIRTLADLFQKVRNREMLDVECLLVIAFLGGIPPLLTSYSSSFYFSDYQARIALPLVLGAVLAMPQRVPDAHTTLLRRLGSLQLRGVVGVGCAVGLVVVLAQNTAGGIKKMISQNLQSRGIGLPTPDSVASDEEASEFRRALRQCRIPMVMEMLQDWATRLENRICSERGILTQLRELDRLPLSEKRQTALFIPRQNAAYWKLLPRNHWSNRDVAFVAPAMTGMAMVDGVPERDPRVARWEGYGFDMFSVPSPGYQQPPLPAYEQQIRERARDLGFKTVIVIDATADGRVFTRKLACL